MGKPLRVVVVGDEHGAALRTATDLEQAGYEPSLFLAPGEADLERLAPGCEIVLACADATSLPPQRVLALAGERGFPPVVVMGDAFGEDDLVGYVRAGARDCVRRGDLRRLEAAVERERLAVRPTLPAPARRVDGDTAESYRALIEEIPALTYVAWADEAGSRAYVSPQLLAMTGFSPGEWLAEPDMWVRRLHPEDRERVLRQFREACTVSGRFASEYRILDRDGRVVWWRDEGRVLPDANGKARFLRGFVLDITEQRMAEESLRRLRLYDQLTGLPNRMMLLNRLGRALVESARTERPLALLILALDRFKEVSNTLGHHNADLIVRDLAARLGDVLGDGDRVARLRSDEFGVLLPDANGSFARQVCERILASLEKPFVVQSLRLPIEVGASAGIAVAPEHGTEAEGLLRRADAAVQAARRLGGGSSVLFSSECEPHDPARLALLSELRRALENNELQLHYQPKVDLKTRTIVGAEALLRWTHSRHGYVSPADFVPLAEQTGLIRPLTRWVLDRATGESCAWARAGRRLPVAVNISARSLQDERIVDDIEEALLTHDVRGEGLQIEVTESAVMNDAGRAAEVLASLTGRGVAVSIDDFGTGFSSLGLLRRLAVNELKIDKSFVIGMSGDLRGSEDTAIVRSTADLAHNLGMTVVAEGVEDQWTLDLLSSFGCDLAQGFHIARPMPSLDFVSWLGQSPWRVIES
ncbi:MAG: putative bifunctional diguanylate cyclase/phosphodiesterase [Burkholderiales bacterium]|jgi:diguanylate cyclase (GGDEF)-like protein/PAS domain S-box-containing protein